MRELTMCEIGFVAGGPTGSAGTAPATPPCPAGTTLSGVTYTGAGSVSSYTCTPNDQLSLNDDMTDLIMIGLETIVAVAAFVGTWILLDR